MPFLMFLMEYDVLLLSIMLLIWFVGFYSRHLPTLLISSILLFVFNLNFLLVLPNIILYPASFSAGIFSLSFPLYVVCLIAGVRGIIRSVGDVATILKGENVVDSWSMLIEQGAGRDKWLLDTIQEFITNANMPGITHKLADVKTNLFGLKRNFIVVSHNTLKDYHMYISARDFGANLDVSWFVTIEPRFFKRTLSKYATGNPQALSQQIDMFDQMDLGAFITTVHHCVKRAIEILLEELKLDPTGMQTMRSKGFLSVW